MATETVQLKVSGLMCSFCTMSVEKALKRYTAIKSVMVNLVHGIVLVEADTAKMDRNEIAEAIEKLGYSVSSTEVQQYETDEALFHLIKTRGIIGMALASIVLLVDPINIFALDTQTRGWFSFVSAAFILLWVGYPILVKTFMALRQRVINANVLLSAAAWGSFIIGTLSLFDPAWPNFLAVAGWLMSLHLFFGFFKLNTRKKAAEAVKKLLLLQPAKARVVRGEALIEVATEAVSVGEIAEVRPGERIPLDGVVINGTASVDESSFTGESTPVSKEDGSAVIGGTLNLDGLLTVKISKKAADSFLHQIIRLMSKISERKPPVELLADRLMNYYGPVVFIVAVIAFGTWLLISGDIVQSVLVLVTTVIMGYPCALGITTPMLAAIAGGKGISTGFLVKASEVFYSLSKVDTIVFDKTGTLTYGKPSVTDVIPVALDTNYLLSIAGSIEEKSEHPLAQAITFFAQKEKAAFLPMEKFKAFPGKGVKGIIQGENIIAGKPSFIEESNIIIQPYIKEEIEILSFEGKTVVVFASNLKIIGIIGLQDTPRPAADKAVARIKEAGYKTVMLTGDAAPVAQAIGSKLGIDEVRAELLPAGKVAAIELLQQKGNKVAMVGDGINDAPALAQSDVGIAIGAGTDVAIESAGVILIGDKLIDVLNAVKLGRKSYKTLTGNVIVAVIFNIVGMGLAALGLITPMIAILFMIVSIFAIFLNTLTVRAMTFEKIETDPQTDLAEVTFKVSNMVCEGCADKIFSILKEVPGVKEVKSKVMQKQVRIKYVPEEVKQEHLKGSLIKSGFNTTEA